MVEELRRRPPHANFLRKSTGLDANAPIVSPGDPYNSCNFGGFDSQTVAADSELEPRVAVDPANSSDAIAVFQQDRWSGGGAKGVLASTSGDGGGNWSEPALSNQP